MALCLLRPSLPSRICRTPAAAALAQRHRMMMSDDARCRGRAPALSPLPTSLVRQGVVALSTKPTLPKLEPEDSRKTQLRKRVFFRFMDYLAGYGKNVLDKILPAKAVQYYRLFMNGTKFLLGDMKEFSWVYNVLSETSDWEKACKSLSRRQLELYMTLPVDLLRVMPVLTVSALPMAQNVVFPLALMYPKRLLSSHFWSPEVRREIEDEQQEKRHLHYRKLLRDVTRVSQSLKDHSMHLAFQGALKKLTVERVQPSPEQILELQELFLKKGAFHLSALNSLHLRHLMRAHGLGDLFWWRYKLAQYGNLLRHIDLAVVREGGVGAMGGEELRSACLWRGMNSREATEEEMREYLTNWIMISEKLEPGSQSLLLHLPIFLGYHHRTRIWDHQSVS